jgi:hypothetical protein
MSVRDLVSSKKNKIGYVTGFLPLFLAILYFIFSRAFSVTNARLLSNAEVQYEYALAILILRW